MTSRRRPAHRPAGFTLVEVLVALVIMTTIAVMAWRGIDGMLRSRESSQASLAQTERLQTVLAQWELDLRSLQDGGSATPLAFDGASLRLTRRQPGGLQVITWTLRNGQLQRWESPPATTQAELRGAYERSLQGLTQNGRQLLALEGLAGWQMFFYRGNAWSNAQSSDDVAQPAGPPAGPASAPTGADAGSGGSRVLPTGVRMILQFAPDSGFGGPLTRQIELGPQS